MKGNKTKVAATMQATKTILDWFEEARSAGHEWADAAIENCHQFGTADMVDISLAEALLGAFDWAETPQGVNFWHAVRDSLLQNP